MKDTRSLMELIDNLSMWVPQQAPNLRDNLRTLRELVNTCLLFIFFFFCLPPLSMLAKYEVISDQ